MNFRRLKRHIVRRWKYHTNYYDGVIIPNKKLAKQNTIEHLKSLKRKNDLYESNKSEGFKP